MRIIIIGGGNIGSNVARYLIRETHQVTIVEKSRSTVERVEHLLDALVIHGDSTDINTLDEAGVKNADLFIPVTDSDNVNILSAILAKNLNPMLKSIVKVKYYSSMFDDKRISPASLGIDYIINPNDLIIDKIISLMDYPDATELINLFSGQVQLMSFTARQGFPFLGRKLLEIARLDEFFQEIRVVAIERNRKLIIPAGENKIQEYDRVFCIAKTPNIELLLKKYIQKGQSLRHLIVSSEPQILPDLVERVRRDKRKITVVEQDKALCRRYTQQLDGVTVINGMGTDASVFRELDTAGACFVSITDIDEFNIVSCATAKNQGIQKVMCSIRDIALVQLISSIASIDSVFSSNVIAAGEILRFTRGGNINSMAYFSGVPAEIIEITVGDPIPAIGKKLKDVLIPAGMIIGAILRDGETIIPTGKDQLAVNDRVTCFILPGSLSAVDSFFGSNLIVCRG